MIALYVLTVVLVVLLIYLAIVMEGYQHKNEQLYSLLKKLDFSKFELSDENKRLIYYGRKYKELMRDYMDDDVFNYCENDVLATEELWKDFMKGDKK